ncbi:MAG: prepilin peptidase [Actinomycetia bacterium]|nr:prepilin peptidase [Actinomycetes bacterium]
MVAVGPAGAVAGGGLAALAGYAVFRRGRWLGVPRDPPPALAAAAAGVAGALVGWAAARGDGWLALALAAVVGAAAADLVARVIPHRWVLALALAGGGEMWRGILPVAPTVLVTLGVAGFLLAVHLVSRGGLGLGDVKLGLGMGLALGWPRAVTALVWGLWLGGMVAAGLLVTHRARRGAAVPLGPFLAVGMIGVAVLTA